jgi:hypothetical protein
MVTQLDKVNNDLSLESGFNMDNSKTLTERFLALRDAKNIFMSTRFTVTQIIGGADDCAISKNYIKPPLVEGQVELTCGHKFHYNCLFKHMLEIQQYPMCHIFIHLDKNGRILNTNSNNYPRADESLIKGIQTHNLPHAPQRTARYEIVKYDIRLDKKDFVLATDSYAIYSRNQCLYHWFQSTRLIACAVHHTLQKQLLTPFREKEGEWRHVLHITREMKGWDAVSGYEDYSNNVSANVANDVMLKILVKGKPMEHYGVYVVEIYNGVLQGYSEIEQRSVNIDYDNSSDAEKKMKEKQAVFEFLYSYTQTVVDPCCVASFKYNPKLGVAMTIIIS